MLNILDKVFTLLEKTNDRCLVLLPEQDQAYAILSLAEYERLILARSQVEDLTEQELLDKINRDIAIWKTQQEDKDEDSEVSGRPIPAGLRRFQEQEDLEDFDDEDEDEYEDDPYYFESV